MIFAVFLITCMDEKTLGAAVSLLKHASPEVQNIVVPLISKMGGPQAAEALKVLETAESEPESQDQQGWDNYLEQLNRLTGGPSAPSESTSESTAIGSDLVSEATSAASSTAQAARDEQILVYEAVSELVNELVILLGDTELGPEVHFLACILRTTLAGVGAEVACEAVPELVNLLRDTELDPAVRIPVAWILGEMGAEACEAVPQLINLIPQTELEPAVRSAVAWALAKLGTVQLPAVVGAVPELVNLLKDRNLDPELCRSLAWTLGKLAPEKTAEEILKKLRDPHLDQRVRCHLARVFAQMRPGAVGAVPQLISVLRDTDLDREVRKSLACALGEMGPAVSKGQLVDLLQESNFDSELRRSLASGFRLESVPLLMELLADPSLSQDHSLLTVAFKRIIDDSALITCMDEKTLGAAVSLLKHASPEVQNIVVPLISKMGGPQAAEALKVLETAESEPESQDQQGWDIYLEQLNRLTGGPSAPSESTSESTAIGSDLVSEATSAASSTQDYNAQAARDEQILEDDIA